MTILKTKKKNWKNENEIVNDKQITFPKVKLRKTELKGDSDCEESGNKNEDPYKTPVKISKSLPIRKPVIVWEEIQEFQKLIPESPTNRKVRGDQGDKISVCTQTDIRQDILNIHNK